MMKMKVAIITGGASGMGLAVATALAKRGDWSVHILDINEKLGLEAAGNLPNANFHKSNVTDYDALANVFKTIFISGGHRLDFVFANAGVIERTKFYAKHPDGPDAPPRLDQTSVDVDLKGVVWTTYLALHYFRQSPEKGKGSSLVMTASCGGLYPSYYSPLYSAAKFGVVGFMRSIAPHFFLDGIRVNAICLGIVRTNLLDKDGWSGFPQDLFIPVEGIADIVLRLIDGSALIDAKGAEIIAGKAFGLAVEISGKNYYIRDQHEYCDEDMRKVMSATEVDNQIGAVLIN